jgi:hypothetical protein
MSELDEAGYIMHGDIPRRMPFGGAVVGVPVEDHIHTLPVEGVRQARGAQECI